MGCQARSWPHSPRGCVGVSLLSGGAPCSTPARLGSPLGRGAPWPREGRAAPSPTPPAASSAFRLKSISAFPKNASCRRGSCHQRHGVCWGVPSVHPHPLHPRATSVQPHPSHLQVGGEHVLQLALFPSPTLLLLVPFCRAWIQAALGREVTRSPCNSRPVNTSPPKRVWGCPQGKGKAPLGPTIFWVPLSAQPLAPHFGQHRRDLLQAGVRLALPHHEATDAWWAEEKKMWGHSGDCGGWFWSWGAAPGGTHRAGTACASSFCTPLGPPDPFPSPRQPRCHGQG